MVFKSKPFRQSPFLSPEAGSVARAENLQGAMDLWPYLRKLATCSGCTINDDYSIDFQAGGQLTLPLFLVMPSPVADLIVRIDTSKTPSGAALQYQVVEATGSVQYAGTLVSSSQYNVNILRIPVYGMVFPSFILSASSAVRVYFQQFQMLNTTFSGNVAATLPYPTAVDGRTFTPWRQRKAPPYYEVVFVWRSTNGNTASITYSENGTAVATLSTTSTSPITTYISRVWLRRNQVTFSYSASANAQIVRIVIYIYFDVPLPFIYTKSVQAQYSTTSTSYVQYTPLSLTATTARIRKIVVLGSSNAKWYVNLDGNKVLDSSWSINSLDFNPPQDAKNVYLYLASADGANATASIIIIYDELSNV
jgi:hypothetical protein